MTISSLSFDRQTNPACLKRPCSDRSLAEPTTLVVRVSKRARFFPVHPRPLSAALRASPRSARIARTCRTASSLPSHSASFPAARWPSVERLSKRPQAGLLLLLHPRRTTPVAAASLRSLLVFCQACVPFWFAGPACLPPPCASVVFRWDDIAPLRVTTSTAATTTSVLLHGLKCCLRP